MKCPYCEEEMERGVIYGDRYSLKWVHEGKDKGPLFQWFVKGIKLTDAFENNSVESFYCENCKKMIIDLEDKIRTLCTTSLY